jgi:hypothetical protein
VNAPVRHCWCFLFIPRTRARPSQSTRALEQLQEPIICVSLWTAALNHLFQSMAQYTFDSSTASYKPLRNPNLALPFRPSTNQGSCSGRNVSLVSKHYERWDDSHQTSPDKPRPRPSDRRRLRTCASSPTYPGATPRKTHFNFAISRSVYFPMPTHITRTASPKPTASTSSLRPPRPRAVSTALSFAAPSSYTPTPSRRIGSCCTRATLVLLSRMRPSRSSTGLKRI